MNLLQTIKKKIKLNKYKKKFNFNFDKTTYLGSSFRIAGRSKALIEIGKNSVIFANMVCNSANSRIFVGDRTYINKGCLLDCSKEIFIGSDVTIGWDVTVLDSNAHSLDWKERSNNTTKANFALAQNKSWAIDTDTKKAEKITISDKVWIGFGSSILRGVTIGEGAVIGAQCVVRNDVTPWSIMIGNPAVKIGEIRH